MIVEDTNMDEEHVFEKNYDFLNLKSEDNEFHKEVQAIVDKSTD